MNLSFFLLVIMDTLSYRLNRRETFQHVIVKVCGGRPWSCGESRTQIAGLAYLIIITQQ